MKQKYIYVCCGGGKLTSYMAAEGIKAGLKKRGFDVRKEIKIEHGVINDIPRLSDRIDILVSSTNYTRQHEFPVVNAIAFVVQDHEGEEKVIDQVEALLNEMKEKEEA